MSFVGDLDTDNFETNKNDWIRIQKFIPKNKKIWSPFYCDGKQGQYFREMGYDIYHEDKDFFEYEPEEYDCIIDNPPFSKKRDILKRLKKLDKPFILILPAVVLSCKYLLEDFGQQLQIIIPTQRIKFTQLGKDNSNYTPPFGTYYYCYKMNLEKDLIIIP
tara:strand:- start:3745 stop:4227 length:483 start_codon:yes stop_codon:yes gene_type:complete